MNHNTCAMATFWYHKKERKITPFQGCNGIGIPVSGSGVMANSLLCPVVPYSCPIVPWASTHPVLNIMKYK
jgi:hypothetical protein